MRRVVEHNHTVWETVRLVSGVRFGSSLQRERQRVTETDYHRPSGTRGQGSKEEKERKKK